MSRYDVIVAGGGPGGENGRALGVSRALLDSMLLDAARAAGADVLERCKACRTP